MQVDAREENKCPALSLERGPKLKAQDCVEAKLLVKILQVIDSVIPGCRNFEQAFCCPRQEVAPLSSVKGGNICTGHPLGLPQLAVFSADAVGVKSWLQ